MPDLSSQGNMYQHCIRAMFSYKKNEVKVGQLFKNISKLKLFEELDKICQQKQIAFRFNIDRLRDKQWMVNVLFILNDQNDVFKLYLDSEKVIGIARDDLNILKTLDTFFGRKGHQNFLREILNSQMKGKYIQLNKKQLV
ncbi:unnamed protein product [Paramecium sonneborni]|uniref:Uncharacterized protein n=1 Tax=Paramecium sonneborni TaxID=65129 RepID=A0A8S1KM32_9CILI|nr:unnamed protein product [Paramecium sonneborni]CAD8055900.1 unnamed protein product [Paramecium sonneborni]